MTPENVNHNFARVKDAVDDNASRIATLRADVDDASARITAVAAKSRTRLCGIAFSAPPPAPRPIGGEGEGAIIAGEGIIIGPPPGPVMTGWNFGNTLVTAFSGRAPSTTPTSRASSTAT